MIMDNTGRKTAPRKFRGAVALIKFARPALFMAPPSSRLIHRAKSQDFWLLLRFRAGAHPRDCGSVEVRKASSPRWLGMALPRRDCLIDESPPHPR
jgi:hypothetical protein